MHEWVKLYKEKTLPSYQATEGLPDWSNGLLSFRLQRAFDEFGRLVSKLFLRKTTEKCQGHLFFWNSPKTFV